MYGIYIYIYKGDVIGLFTRGGATQTCYAVVFFLVYIAIGEKAHLIKISPGYAPVGSTIVERFSHPRIRPEITVVDAVEKSKKPKVSH